MKHSGGEIEKAKVSLSDWTCTRSRKQALKLRIIPLSDNCVPDSVEDALKNTPWSMSSRKTESHSLEGTSLLTMAQAK